MPAQPFIIHTMLMFNGHWEGSGGVGSYGFPADQWLAYRIPFFFRWTLPCLKRQKDVVVDVVGFCREGDDSKREMEPYLPYFEEAGINLVYGESIPYFQQRYRPGDAIYLFKMDNDDLIADDTLKLAFDKLEGLLVTQLFNGYHHFVTDGRLQYWRDKSPPFYLFHIWLSWDGTTTIHPHFMEHQCVAPIFPQRRINGKFCVMAHHMHSSGYHRQDNKLVPEAERQAIRDEFHLEEDKVAWWDARGCSKIVELLERPVAVPDLPASIPYDV